MIPGNFEYHKPTSVEEAVGLLGRYGEDGKLLAGGHSLIPMMKLRLAEPAHLIDLAAIPDLTGIREDDGRLRIGAMTTQMELINSDVLQGKCPVIPEASLQISDPQVRGWGTIGGNAANGDPGNDLPAVLMAVDAEYVLAKAGGERVVPANGFYKGSFFTEMGEDELLTEIRIPTPPAGHGWAYRKMKRKIGDYAVAAAAVVLTVKGDSCDSVAIALTNVGPTPLRAEEAERLLVGQTVDDAAIDRAVEAVRAVADPVEDLHGPVDFRTHVAGEMARRAVRDALSRARGG